MPPLLTLPSPLVAPYWLQQHLENPDLIILDATVPYGPNGPDEALGLASWAAGRIPGARFARLQSHLSDATTGFGFSRPQPDALVEALAELGIGEHSTVVIYDNFLNMWATRVWWLLRGIGFERAAVLDGGFKAWVAEGLSVEAGSTAPVARADAPLHARALTGFNDVGDVLGRAGGGALVCALPESYFDGSEAVNGRHGHIPGSVNIPAASLLNEAGQFLPVEVLRQKLAGVAGAPTITLYCGGGISATIVAFALHLIGAADNVSVYDGSLEEWNADPTRPLVGGSARNG